MVLYPTHGPSERHTFYRRGALERRERSAPWRHFTSGCRRLRVEVGPRRGGRLRAESIGRLVPRPTPDRSVSLVSVCGAHRGDPVGATAKILMACWLPPLHGNHGHTRPLTRPTASPRRSGELMDPSLAWRRGELRATFNVGAFFAGRHSPPPSHRPAAAAPPPSPTSLVCRRPAPGFEPWEMFQTPPSPSPERVAAKGAYFAL